MPYGQMIPDASRHKSNGSLGSDFLKALVAAQQNAVAQPQQSPMEALLNLQPGQTLLQRLQSMQSPAPRLANILNPKAVDNLLSPDPGSGITSIENMVAHGRHAEPQTTLEPMPQPDYADQLIAQLNALAGATGAPMDVDAMIQDASGGINKAYGAQIGSIRHQNQGARADTREGAGEIQKMYKALARTMRRSGRREARQGNKLAADLQAIGGRTANQINESAGDLLEQNAASANALGDPNVAKELNAQVEAQAGRNTDRALSYASNQAANQRGLSGVQQRYFEGAGIGARAEGTNRAADLFANLQDYLQGNRDKIAEIAGQRAQALAEAKNSILASVAASQQDQNQQLFENKMSVAQFAQDLENAKNDNAIDWAKIAAAGGQGSSDPFSQYFDKDAGNVASLLGLAGQSGDANLMQVPQLYQQLMQSPEAMQGYIDQGHNNQFELGGNAAAQWALINQYAANASPQAKELLFQLLAQTGFQSNRPSY